MSRILCVCLRHHSRQAFDELRRRIATGAARLQPRNSTVRPLRLVASGRIVTGIFHPSATNLVRGTSVCIGCTVASRQRDEPGTPKPEGTYAICRSDGRTLEILSDAVGSRTLWYYMDDSIFIASSSQRWIACVLGTFVPNAAAMTWMLVTGCLGPVHAWDSRVRRLPPDCTLTLDPDRWTARLSVSESLFEAAREKAARRKERLRQLLCETFEELHLDRSKWVLALSGGYDSRGLLCLARQPGALRTITWGTRRSLANPASDSAVASSLATAVGASHEYFETDLVAGSLASVLEAFIAIGEGRIDHLSGYLDGFALWRRLAGRGIEGVIRGDEGFGWNRVSSFEDARRSVGLLLWSDFGNLPSLDELGLPEQEMPAALRRRRGETPSQWRDRLYHEYRIPAMLAALTDLKTCFVEIANPLLSHSIIRLVRCLPDRMRTDKALFRAIVDEVGPDVPFATAPAIASPGNVLRTAEAGEILLDTLGSHAAHAILPSLLLNRISAGVARAASASGAPRPGAARRLVSALPAPVRVGLRRFKRHWQMDFHAMALRVCIITRMHELLEADASARKARHADETLPG